MMKTKEQKDKKIKANWTMVFSKLNVLSPNQYSPQFENIEQARMYLSGEPDERK